MFEMSMSAEMEMRVTPALLNLAHMLTLPSIALHHLVQQELGDNPALEEIELQDEDGDTETSDPFDDLLYDADNPSYEHEPRPIASNDDAVDALLFVAAPRSLNESLLEDLYASLPRRDHSIALLVVGNLDERGFLAETVDNIALTLNVASERVAAVLTRLQEVGPPGIGTRDVRECMLAQIAALEEAGEHCPHVATIVGDYLDDLGAHRYKQIAQRLHISIADVEAVRAFVQEHLWPYPAQQVPASAADPNRPRYSLPDVAIVEHQGKFTVEVLHSPRRMLRLSPLYRDLARRATNLEEAERTHVHDYITRARTFLANLRQRETTLQQITEAVVKYQEPFLRHGVRHMAALTRAEIAADTGLHESTVSRATNDKTVLLPPGTTMPFSDFFIPSLGVQDILREMIENETEPLSDAELARMLAERGHPIARRTVAKYREQMQILPSTLR
jgi:RNA polymerase sigma-54 factor